MCGRMEVHSNRWIEEWNAGRENLELNFRLTQYFNFGLIGR
jgi:hypothetical protein